MIFAVGWVLKFRYQISAGVYNFTVVTAMVDIGREQWSNPEQRVSYNTYLLFMQRVLRLDVNMVIFVDAKARPFVDWMRRGRQSRTHVVEKNFKDLPYYAHRDRVQEIMNSDEYRKDNELVKNKLCESLVPEYDILQWSKLYFIHSLLQIFFCLIGPFNYISLYKSLPQP